MKLFAQLKLGSIALGVVNAVRDGLKTLDIDDIISIVGKIVELERLIRGSGNGSEKWGTLLKWFEQGFPKHKDHIEMLRTLTTSLVALLNALGVFKK